MVTVKQIQIPQPQAEALMAARPREPRIKPDKRTGKWAPRHPALVWTPMPYMEEFLRELRSRERKEDYIKMVRVGLSHLATYMRDTKGIGHPARITRDDLLDFQAWVQTDARTSDGNPFQVSYQRKLMCYIRSWILWMEDMKYLDKSPWEKIRVIRTPKTPHPLLQDEIAALFETHRRQRHSMKLSPFAWHRQEVILVLLYAWGLRIHELESLNLAQMDLRRPVVHVKNKGHQRPKPLPYSDVIKQTVQRYLVCRAAEAEPGEEALLVEHTWGGRLSKGSIYKIVIKLGEQAGVTVNPHRLRDSFGTVMANSGAEIEHVQIMMGHSRRAQTMEYVELADERVIQTHQDKMDPILDDLMTGLSDLPEGIDEPPAGWPQLEKKPTAGPDSQGKPRPVIDFVAKPRPFVDDAEREQLRRTADMILAHRNGEHRQGPNWDCIECIEEAEFYAEQED